MTKKKITEEDKKSICMLLDMGEFTQKEVSEKYGVVYSTINKIYREHLQGDVKSVDDNFAEKNTLDEEEVRLINKTLMQENEDLRRECEVLKATIKTMCEKYDETGSVNKEKYKNIELFKTKSLFAYMTLDNRIEKNIRQEYCNKIIEVMSDEQI